jgi:GntR family transcriptional regulator
VEQIEVVTASAGEAQVLDVPAGSPLLAITRTTTDADGAPIEFSQDLFRADRIRIVVRTPGAAGASPAEPGGGRVIELRPHSPM